VKVLHINTERTWRGGEQQTLYLLQGLSQRQVDCHLVCQPDSPMAAKARGAGVTVFPVAMRGEADLAAVIRLRQLIRADDYDVLHSHTSHAHTLAFFASVGCRVSRLVTRRVNFSIFRSRILRLNGIKYRFMADYYIAISQKIKENRIGVIHSGIDPARFAKASGEHLSSEFDLVPGQAVVIHVGHLTREKGQRYLISAIPHVLEKIPEARFFIIGEGELLTELQSLSASLGITRALIFTGFRDDVGAFYNIADLFVMSSVQEGLGTAVLDALALGKPVVATNTGGIPEIIKDGQTGRLVEAANPQVLANGIIEMLTQKDQALKMAERGQAVAREQFCIDAMVENYIAVYRQLLDL
jgi:glycosyltransferase involved in cell wall biosynthesis